MSGGGGGGGGPEATVWTSPDGRIRKRVLDAGSGDPGKPHLGSVCTVEVSDVARAVDSEHLNAGATCTLTLGFAETACDRELEKCVMSMRAGERSEVTFSLGAGAPVNAESPVNVNVNVNVNVTVTATVKLCAFEHHGLVFEWDAVAKHKMAAECKERGVRVFRAGRAADSSHLFSRGLKLLLSIPVPVDEPPADRVDGLEMARARELRANLYSNLASCNLKLERFENAVQLCDRALLADADAAAAANVKALYKRGVALEALGRFDEAKRDMVEVLRREAGNGAALAKVRGLDARLAERDREYAVMVKRMFKT